MRHAKQNTKKKTSAIQIVRAVIQLICFILIPGLFITLFSALGSLYTAIIGDSFVLSEQAVNILLVVMALLITFIWGRFFCGFICSFGAMQDLLWLFGRHLPTRIRVPEKVDRVLKYLKYAVLLFIVIGVWTFGVFGDTVWSPWTVFGAVASPWKGLPPATIVLSVGGALLLLTVIGSLLIERFFCKYLCPLGAVFTLLSRFRIFRIKKSTLACGSCTLCSKKCSMAIPLRRYDEISSGECINCMKCTTACYRDNVKAGALPAVSGTVMAAALAGVTFVGTLPQAQVDTAVAAAPQRIVATEVVGKYKDGVYVGSAAGYRGNIALTVTVQGGSITDITVNASADDAEFLNKAKSGVIPAILKEQDTDVDTVSGATYSSLGIINAVSDALSTQLTSGTTAATSAPTEKATTAPTQAPTQAPTEAATEAPARSSDASSGSSSDRSSQNTDQDESNDSTSQGSYTDGVYTGYGSGYRGTTEVQVTVENGNITDITVLSYQDDDRFFSNAEYGVIAAILSEQSVDVDTVSGATFSSNSIIEAVADALGESFSNPNSSMESDRGGHGFH